MKTILLAMLAVSAPSLEVGLPVKSAQSRDDLTLCVARKLKGAPMVLSNRTVIDEPTGALVGSGSTYFSVTIEERGSERVITSFYRKPLNERVGFAYVRRVAKSCFAEEFNAALMAHPVEGLKPIQS